MAVPIFLVERRFAEDLEASAEVNDRINRINEEEGVRWLYSFLSADKRKTYCLYEAPLADAIRRALLREVGGLVAQDTRRKRLARHPNYVPLEASVDAGPTEVEDADPVGLM